MHAHVLIVDASPTRAHGIQQIVQRFPYVATTTLCTPPELYAAAAAGAPDIVLLSPGRLPDDDLTTFARLRRETGGCRLITYGSATRTRVNPPNIAAGLYGYLPGDSTPDDYDRTLSAALAGFTHFPQEVTAELAEYRTRFPDLTPREQQVLNLLAGGLTNQRIAKTLGLKEATVKMYVTQVFAKLHVESRVQAVLKARGFTTAA